MAKQSSTADFVGSIPEIYDTLLGPVLFEFSAADMARRVAATVTGPVKILEVACGTGVSTRFLATHLPVGSEILATDLNEAMLAHAARVNGSLPGVTYSQADALDLPFRDGMFDAVVCQFGIMFFPNKGQGMHEMARVLKPGGLLALNVWDSLQENPSAQIMDDAVKSHFENDPPRFFETPFGSITPETGKALYVAAGLPNVSVSTLKEYVHVPDYYNLARGYITGSPVALEIQNRATVSPEDVITTAAKALEERFGPAPAKIPFQESIFLATKTDH